MTMRTTRLVSRTLTLMVAAAPILLESPAPAQISGPVDVDLNRFSVNGRLGFNIKANFSGTGQPLNPGTLNPGSATGSGENRTYADGYVRVDSSGNAGGLTWNWGYSAAVVPVSGSASLVLHSVAATPNTSMTRGATDDPQYGFDLNFGRVLIQAEHFNVGLEGAFGFSDTSIRDRGTLTGQAVRTTDTYPLGGIIPLSTAYSGTFNGPGPLIQDNPVTGGASTRQMDLVTDYTAVNQHLEASLYGFRLGPFVEVPIARRLTATVSGGLAFTYVESDFKYTEEVTITGVTPAFTFSRGGGGSTSEWLVGPYAAATLSYAVSEQVSVSAGVQYQNLGTTSHEVAGKKAELDLRDAIFVTLGVGVKF
jgi:hypothetical protein